MGKAGRKRHARTRRGPRPRGSRPLDRDVILSAGLALTKSQPLQDVSIVRVAQEFGVTPASIHYYLDGRDTLTFGIINLFFRDLLSEWPILTGVWSADLEALAEVIYRHYVRYPGIAAYFAGQNRFRVLVQSNRPRGEEHRFRFLERYFMAIDSVGLPARRGAVYALVLIQFIIASAHATANHQLPGEQRHIRTLLGAVEQKEYPTIHQMRASYLAVAGDDVFAAGIRVILAGLQAERRKGGRNKC